MTISNYLEDKLLDLVLRNATFPAITAVWASIHTGDPGETGTASPLASCPRFPVVFNAAASATSVNATAASVVTSASAAAITHIGLWDGSATATANHLWSGAMSSGGVRITAAGSTVVIASGVLRVTLS